ncbi:MAG: NAD(+)/NADH kinase [bacterium JZ-2024 1]
MTIGIKLNPLNPSARETLPFLLSCLEQHCAIRIYDGDAREEDMYVWKHSREKEVDLLISLGGDGTMLTAGRFAFQQDVPLLGVNLGRFGFLTEISYEELPRWTPVILQGRYSLEPRCILEGEVNGKKFICVNDFVVKETEMIRTSRITIILDGEEFPDIPSDGVIISTPTGSTGYNLSVGGPIIHPQIRGIAVSFIAPHLLTFRPLLVPPSSRIGVRLHKPGNIIVDGQFVISLESERSVYFTASKQTLPIVRLKGTTFYSTLQKKFQWGTGK